MLICGVDCGRDSIKSGAWIDGEIQTKKIFSRFKNIDFEKVRRQPIHGFDPDEDLIASINKGIPIAYGRMCNKISASDDIGYVTADATYIEYSVNYTLISISRFLEETKTSKSKIENVYLGINLTGNNMNCDEFLREKLKNNGKEWRIDFYDPQGEIISTKRFTIDLVGIYPQGWPAYLDYAIDDKSFEIHSEWANSQTLMLDGGRKTFIGVLVNLVGPVKEQTYNLGMEYYYKYVKEQLYKQHNVTKKTIEIEEILREGKGINKNGFYLDLEYLSRQAIMKMTEELVNDLLEDFSTYNPDYIIYTGGQSYTFIEHLQEALRKKEIFSDLQAHKNPVFGNAIGLTKLLTRKFIFRKKGS